MTKLEQVKDAKFVASDPDEYEYGQFNFGKSVPIGYWVTGKVYKDIKVGQHIMIARDCRNGKKVDGILETSSLQKIEKMSDSSFLLITKNSGYKLEILSEPKENHI